MAKNTKLADFQVSRIQMPGEAPDNSGGEVEDLDGFSQDVPEEDEVATDELEGQVTDDSGLEDQEEALEDEEPEADEEAEETDEEFSYSALVSDLAAEGVLHITEGKEYDDTPEGFQEIIQDTAAQRVQDTIAKLPPTAQKLMELALKGAEETDLQQYLALEDGPDWEEADLDDEEVQESVVEEAMRLKEPELTDEEIAEAIADLKDLGKLEARATRDQKYLVKHQDAQKKAVEDAIAHREVAAAESYQQEVTKVKNYLQETQEIANLALTKKDREDFLAYLTVKDKSGLTQSDKQNTWERRIQKEYLNFKNFNLGKLKQQAVTEATKEVKKQLGRYNAGRQRSNAGERPQSREAFGGRIILPGEFSAE